MTAESAQDFQALEKQAEKILEVYTARGFERVAPSILQPADLFLDEIGEAIRGRTYVFTSPGGAELCLRPDLTIPSCRVYLERDPDATTVARYSYNGSTFRYQPGGATATRPREFRQAGVELFGASDEPKAEAEILSTIISAVNAAGVEQFKLHMGDLSLYFALLESLDIPDRRRKKLSHYFWRPKLFNKVLWAMCEKQHSAVPKNIRPLISVLDTENYAAAEEQVVTFLDDNEIPLIGTRPLSDITTKLMEMAADLHEDPLPEEHAELIETYLAISGPPKAAGARIADLVGTHGIDISSALKAFNRRLDVFQKAGIDLSNANFSAEFGRKLEYYTGFVFQIEIDDCGSAGYIAGGGRYDTLMQRVGAPQQVTAVGAAIHTERLLAASHGDLEVEEPIEEDIEEEAEA